MPLSSHGRSGSRWLARSPHRNRAGNAGGRDKATGPSIPGKAPWSDESLDVGGRAKHRAPVRKALCIESGLRQVPRPFRSKRARGYAYVPVEPTVTAGASMPGGAEDSYTWAQQKRDVPRCHHLPGGDEQLVGRQSPGTIIHLRRAAPANRGSRNHPGHGT